MRSESWGLGGKRKVCLAPCPRHRIQNLKIAVVVALSLAVLSTACGGGDSEAVTGTLARYIGAVQEQNFPALWALRAWDKGVKEGVTPPPEFEAEANRYFAGYEIGKRAAELQFDSWGIGLVRALALGKGAYYRIVAVERPRDDARFVKVHVPLPYENLDYSPFPEGATLYFLVHPWGKMQKHVVGEAPVARGNFLSEITLRWTLVRERGALPLSPTGWLVLAVEAEEGSARFREMEIRISGP